MVGIRTARALSDPAWDEAGQRWTWTLEEILNSQFPDNEARFWTFGLQYLDGETPQQTIDGASLIFVEFRLDYTLGEFVSENDNRTMSVSLVGEMYVSDLDTPAQTIEVAGSDAVFADFTIQGDYSEFYTDIVSLNSEFTLAPGGCPTGTGVLTIRTTQVEWTYAGGAAYDWWITDQEVLAQGSATLPCGN